MEPVAKYKRRVTLTGQPSQTAESYVGQAAQNNGF
jgi:hypothetical protein